MRVRAHVRSRRAARLVWRVDGPLAARRPAAAARRRAASSYLGMTRAKTSSEQDAAQSLEIRQGRATAFYEARGRAAAHRAMARAVRLLLGCLLTGFTPLRCRRPACCSFRCRGLAHSLRRRTDGCWTAVITAANIVLSVWSWIMPATAEAFLAPPSCPQQPRPPPAAYHQCYVRLQAPVWTTVSSWLSSSPLCQQRPRAAYQHQSRPSA